MYTCNRLQRSARPGVYANLTASGGADTPPFSNGARGCETRKWTHLHEKTVYRRPAAGCIMASESAESGEGAMKIAIINGQNHKGSTRMIARELAEKLGGEI